MGLFNRAFKSNPSTNGQPPPVNGDVPNDDTMPPADLEQPERAVPKQPERPVSEPSERPVDEQPERAVREQTEPPPPAPEQTPPQESPERHSPAGSPPQYTPRDDAAARTTSSPPTNPAPPDHSDEDRISASEALAPTRRPGSSRLPGAAIGDESERRAKIISFANQKGGVAKTTTTLNLAVAFEESGHDVLAVDLDPQGNLTMSQGIDPDKVEGSMYDVLVDHVPIRSVIHDREIDVAVASIDLAGAELALSSQIGRERTLQ